jgi:hypothetical protein
MPIGTRSYQEPNERDDDASRLAKQSEDGAAEEEINAEEKGGEEKGRDEEVREEEGSQETG